ncbi:nitroreductase family protein [Fusobacterium ulcerans]|uniref:nitroreductase family protein n=1 Tax=Fusobacterium ulcerans TaxID=861 RepID=UPI001D0A9509|nr:nitroreductase family protein [Fusobacterium ulcerans]MCB8564833.1 nitroreductase family protein [Fusobacterium ulcerans]MCB8648761.1 nitroreductase family protein [Fusobacterium ulcerans]
MNCLDLIMKRKSVRVYEEKEIPIEVKDKILAAAFQAPTAGNMMMYSIIEIDDQSIKDKLVKTCDNQGMIGKAPLLLLFLADFQRWMDYIEASEVKDFNKENNFEEYIPKEGDMFLAINDALIAAQTTVLAAEDFGLGSCYIGDIMENFEIHKELFNLPKYTLPITMLCIGYPTEQQKNRTMRRRYFSKDMIVHKNSYRKPSVEEFKAMDKEIAEKDSSVFLPGCHNQAIHMYKRKITSDFMSEMNRSVKAMIDSWMED